MRLRQWIFCGVITALAVVGFSQEADARRRRDPPAYVKYQMMRDKCPVKDDIAAHNKMPLVMLETGESCCMGSVTYLEQNGLLPEFNGRCAEGMELQQLDCPTSYQWCGLAGGQTPIPQVSEEERSMAPPRDLMAPNASHIGSATPTTDKLTEDTPIGAKIIVDRKKLLEVPPQKLAPEMGTTTPNKSPLGGGQK